MLFKLIKNWRRENDICVYLLIGAYIVIAVLDNFVSCVMPGFLLNWIVAEKTGLIFLLITANAICSLLAGGLQQKWEKDLFLFRLHEIGSIQQRCIMIEPGQLEQPEGKERIETVMQSVASGNEYGIEAYVKAGIFFCTNIFQILLFFTVMACMPSKIWILTIGFVALLIPYELLYQKKQVGIVTESMKHRRYLEEYRRCILDPQYAKDVRMREGVSFTKNILKKRTSPLMKCMHTRTTSRIKHTFFSVFLMLFNMVAFLVAAVRSGAFLAGDYILYIGMIAGIYIYVGRMLESSSIMRENKEVCRTYLDVMENVDADENLTAKIQKKDNDSMIHFQGVSFSYGDRIIFHDLSFDIKKGERIAIVGANGVGKTTLVKLILGILEQSEGIIRVCGEEDYKDFDCFSSCMQEDPILPLTVASNISCKPDDVTDRNRVTEAAKKAGVTGFVSEDQLDKTACSLEYYDDGIDFSGGERQKIHIARMLYKDSEILLLDEPTASLDAKAELEIYQLYHALAGG